MKSKNSIWLKPLILLSSASLLLLGCPLPGPELPTLTTTTVVSFTSTSAVVGGHVAEDGGSDVTVRGICWNISPLPTIANNKSSEGAGVGSFNSSLTGLVPGAIYFARAYATNSAGTAYGSEVTFTTAAILSTITTTQITATTSTSATSGGNITLDGGGSISARGVCWSTTTNPTISNSKTSDGTGKGSFVSSLTGLQPGKTYYVKAYATNSAGTAYGNEISFAALANLPYVTTNPITAITTTSASSGGNISMDGGASITSRGICWSTAINPTISNNKTTDGGGTGNFTSLISGLNPGIKYYVRAYATNSAGTAYGNEISLTTLANLATITTTIGGGETSYTFGGTISSDGGSQVTARGVCWSTNSISMPTILDNKTTEGNGIGSFSSSINNLLPRTVYYLRAYATNGVGTSYGNLIYFRTIYPQPDFNKDKLIDVEGNVYWVVSIGNQNWMQSNLETTKYKDGTPIPLVTDNNSWNNLTTPAYCWYDNNAAANKNTYGALYNWFTVNTGKLCPTGWHVPTDSDWTVLTNYLGGESIAGGKLKEAYNFHWLNPNNGATNEIWFSALPAGYRRFNGPYDDIETDGMWWSQTNYSSTTAWGRSINHIGINIYRDNDYEKRNGFSVRCIKD